MRRRHGLNMSGDFQEEALQTRLKIPLLYGIDAVHGHNNIDGAVIFPHHIGMGATHNPKTGGACRAGDGRGSGRDGHPLGVCAVHRGSAGRALGAHLRGLQRTTPCAGFPNRTPPLSVVFKVKSFPCELAACVLACAKHFIGDGGDERTAWIRATRFATLRRRCASLYLPPCRAAIKAGVGSASWFPTAAGTARRCTGTNIC